MLSANFRISQRYRNPVSFRNLATDTQTGKYIYRNVSTLQKRLLSAHTHDPLDREKPQLKQRMVSGQHGAYRQNVWEAIEDARESIEKR